MYLSDTFTFRISCHNEYPFPRTAGIHPRNELWKTTNINLRKHTKITKGKKFKDVNQYYSEDPVESAPRSDRSSGLYN